MNIHPMVTPLIYLGIIFLAVLIRTNKPYFDESDKMQSQTCYNGAILICLVHVFTDYSFASFFMQYLFHTRDC